MLLALLLASGAMGGVPAAKKATGGGFIGHDPFEHPKYRNKQPEISESSAEQFAAVEPESIVPRGDLIAQAVAARTGLKAFKQLLVDGQPRSIQLPGVSVQIVGGGANDDEAIAQLIALLL